VNGGRRDLCDLAVGLCDGVLPLLPPGPPVDAVGAVRSRLTESALRIAVGGRLNAGKSTLVNALLGRRLAATASTECTMLVAWFRKGPQNRIEVRLADGRRHCVSGRPGGGVPYDVTRLGAPREQIEEIVVEVTDCLATGEYTLVDTPGMDSLSGLDDVAMRVLARTDALLYVMPHPGAGDLEALEALRRQAGARVTAINAVGVLSRIDELGPGVGDPWVDGCSAARSPRWCRSSACSHRPPSGTGSPSATRRWCGGSPAQARVSSTWRCTRRTTSGAGSPGR
jgi:hypothetical protein